MKPRAISAPDRKVRYSEERLAASLVATPRADWSTKCSVTKALRRACCLASSSMAGSVGRGVPTSQGPRLVGVQDQLRGSTAAGPKCTAATKAAPPETNAQQ